MVIPYSEKDEPSKCIFQKKKVQTNGAVNIENSIYGP
jgi:hypothetical protein